jgi:hypothetical protein
MTDLLATFLDGHSDLVTVCLAIVVIVLLILLFKFVTFLISKA